MLQKILIGVAAVVLVFVVVVATRPSAYRVERKLEVAASPEVVFGVLNDLRQVTGVLVIFGEPWETRDPGMEKSFEGPPAGVGQSYAWSGNSDAGKGKMTIEESVPGQKVGIRLDFEKPMKSTAAYTLGIAPAPSGSTVTWTMSGQHNFLGKAFGLFLDMDGMLGKDIEMSLAKLKTAVETTARRDG